MKPRKPIKEVRTRYLPPDDDDEPTPPAMSFDPAEESFSQFRSKFGTEGVLVKIYRRTPRGAQYCFFGTPSEIDEEVVRLYHAKQPYAHEEGDYFARCFVNGEARDSFPIPIAPQIATPGTSENGGMASQGGLVQLLTAHLQRLEERISQMQQTEREPLSSLADAMVKLQSLQPKAELPIDTLMKAIEIGKTLSGNADGGGEWTPIIKEVLTQAGPALGAVLSGIAASRNPAAASTPNQIEGGNMQSGTMADDMMLKQAFAFLKRKCLAGSDPGLYIDIIIDNRDEATYQKLIRAVITREFSSFAAIDAEIQQEPFRKFFEFIYNGLRSAASGANSVAEDTGGKSGNASDSGSNGESRKAGGKKS